MQQLLTMLTQEQGKHGFKKIYRLELDLSPLAGIDQQALQFAFESISRDTLLEGATLVLRKQAATAFCLHCAQEISILQEGQSCPLCHHHQWVAKNDPPLTVASLMVEG